MWIINICLNLHLIGSLHKLFVCVACVANKRKENIWKQIRLKIPKSNPEKIHSWIAGSSWFPWNFSKKFSFSRLSRVYLNPGLLSWWFVGPFFQKIFLPSMVKMSVFWKLTHLDSHFLFLCQQGKRGYGCFFSGKSTI